VPAVVERRIARAEVVLAPELPAELVAALSITPGRLGESVPPDAVIVAPDPEAYDLAVRFPDAETLPPRDVLRGRAIGARVAALAGVGSRLRRDCPWDRRQSLESIAPHTVDEAFEVAEAIGTGERDHIVDEVGDLLFQAVFFGQLLEEEGAADLGTIADGQRRKLISRHPHVYGEDVAASVSDVKDIWEREKRRERADQGIFHDLPPGLPALAYAAKTRKRAASAGFRFAGAEPALAKLREEVDELAAQPGAAELGDVIFAVVGLAAELGVDAELAVRGTATRFRHRIESAVALAAEAGDDFEGLDPDAQYAWYRRAKDSLRA
jgi:MazG family protein